MKKFNLLAGIGVSVLALVPAKAAQAQASAQPAPRASSSEVGEVVVTATKAGVTNLQKTPLSVAVVGGGDLAESRVVTLRDLASSVAALKITNANSNVVVTIRGVGGFAQNNEQDVGIYQDGVYLGRSITALQSNFNDLERVEVVKGPQGTTFGRNSVGGALNFISKGPSDTFEFENTLNLGNYKLVDEAFRLSGPIIKDKVSGALSFGYFNHDGYIKNLVPSAPNASARDVNAANRYNARGQLKFDLAPNLTNLFRVDALYTSEDWAVNSTLYLPTNDPRFLSCNAALVCTYAGYNSPIANSKIGDYHYYANPDTPTQSQWDYGVNDELTWEINDKFTLKNLMAYRTSKSFGWTPGNGTEYHTGGTQATYRQHQFSNEVNLQNDLGKLTGVVGLYYWQEYQRQVGDSIGNLAAPPVRATNGPESYQDTRFPTKSYALFFNESFHFTPDLSVTVGGRYTKEHKELDTYNTSNVWIGDLPAGWPDARQPYGVPGAPSPPTIVLNSDGSVNPNLTFVFPFILGWDGKGAPRKEQDTENFSPKVGVEWQANENAFLYGSVTQGFKSGGFSFQARNAYNISYQPEEITAYELGAKTDWFDKRLRVNLAAFRNNWTNLQVSQSVVLPGSPLPVGITSNAATARITGLDGDITAKPGAGFTFNASFTWLPDAQYLDYTGGQAANYIKNLLIQAKDPKENAGFNTYNASGNRIIKAPKFSGIFNAEKKFDLSGGAEISFNGDVNFTSSTSYDISNYYISNSKPLTLFNGSVGYTSVGGHYQLGVWGRNLADKSYPNSIIIGNLPQVVAGNPRTFGVRLNYKY